MASKKANAAQQAAAVSPNEPSLETMTLLRYGTGLYDEFAAQSAADAHTCHLRLQRYGDYLEHFGFSPERELPPQSQGQLRSARSPSSLPQEHVPAEEKPSCLWGAPIDLASWTMPETEKSEADARCSELVAPGAEGASTLSHTLPAITALLTQGYSQRTWRQTESQCERKKIRILFRWLCQHLTTIQVREQPLAPPAIAKDGEAGAAKKTQLPSAKGASRAAADRRANDQGRKKNGKGAAAAAAAALAADENATPSPPPDPLQTALDTRACTPAVAARLYQAMLALCQVPCDVVEGLFKGFSPTETVPWAWNRVTFGGRQYLIDVAATIFSGSLREGSGADASSTSSADQLANTTASTAASTLPSKRRDSKRMQKSAAAEADAAKANNAAGALPLPSLCLSDGPQWAEGKTKGPPLLTEFFFCANPAEFIYTHLPSSSADTLLCTPPNRASWEVAPRLSDGFFAFPARLHSHQQSCLISVRSTPFYVTLVNPRPDTTELCAMLYPCSLHDLPEQLCSHRERSEAADLSAKTGPSVTALGPQWVWHQRQESTNTETFTVMAPEAGFYSVVVGARTIRRDPYSCQLASDDAGFVPIVRYEAKVNFTPVSYSLLPRQHLSPSVVRLVAPLSQQLQAGRHTFAVMPTCSNVLGVGLVACTAKAADSVPAAPAASGGGDKTGHSKVTGNSKAHAAVAVPPAPQVQRRLIRFLEFDPLNAVYAGDADLKSGETVEVWIHYGAPDHNGLTLREKVANAAVEKAVRASPPCQPPAETGTQQAPAAGKGPGSRAGGRKAAEVPASSIANLEERKYLSHRVAAGEVFVPAFSQLQVRKMASAEAAEIIQPQPTVAEERSATLRRLIGVTADLYQQATRLKGYKAAPVGTFFVTPGSTAV